MRPIFARIAGGMAATLVAICIMGLPAQAAQNTCKTKAHCHSTRVAKKKTPMRMAARRHLHVVVNAWPAKRPAKWYGWVTEGRHVVFYHEGTRYCGGTPYGPAMWYNNYEGGFNAAVFWKLYDREHP
jgi:hypothetical protein